MPFLVPSGRALRGLLGALDLRRGLLARELLCHAGGLLAHGLAEEAVDADRGDGDQGHDDDVLGHALAERFSGTELAGYAGHFEAPLGLPLGLIFDWCDRTKGAEIVAQIPARNA